MRPRRRPICFVRFKEDHISLDCPLKDKVDLKFFTRCGIGDHSLDNCPIILENIMNEKNVNHLPQVPKNEILNTKKLQAITNQG